MAENNANNTPQTAEAEPLTRRTEDTVLEVRDLKTYFYTEEGEVRAVDGVTFSMERGKILALVGESGCGKSVTAYSVMRLIQKPGVIKDGDILIHTKDGETFNTAKMADDSDEIFHVRGGVVSMIFQEPMTALSPVHTIGNQICEAILLHQDVTEEEAEARAVEMLTKVGIPGAENRLGQYPFEMSGGMRQRVVIAMALVCNPEILIADEPTTALDVTIQAQIMGLIKGLQKEFDSGVLLITHDLGVVAQTADEVAVMYLGRIVEQADLRPLFKSPRHPYTMSLLKSLPSLSQTRERLASIRGSVPSLMEIPPGCPFHPRCDYHKPGVCDVGAPPPLRELWPDHTVACYRAEEIHEDTKA